MNSVKLYKRLIDRDSEKFEERLSPSLRQGEQRRNESVTSNLGTSLLSF